MLLVAENLNPSQKAFKEITKGVKLLFYCQCGFFLCCFALMYVVLLSLFKPQLFDGAIFVLGLNSIFVSVAQFLYVIPLVTALLIFKKADKALGVVWAALMFFVIFVIVFLVCLGSFLGHR